MANFIAGAPVATSQQFGANQGKQTNVFLVDNSGGALVEQQTASGSPELT